MFAPVTKLLLITLFTYRCSAASVNGQFYPYYHSAPPYGWMNDPNGFCFYNNEYHLFYQHNPETSQEPGIAHWGHMKSSDLMHWEHLPIALYPDQDYDKTGVFSGSAIIENGTMYLLYTGNVNHADETPDHTQRQALAYNTNVSAVTFTKYPNNPVIMGEEHQPNIRDPKVWKHEDTFYMVLGNSFNNNTLGRVLLYSSEDLITWKQVSILDESDGYLGYMWECPDFFEINGYFVLLFSPQGMQSQGDNYRNLYQTGYIVGLFDYETLLFTPLTQFRELDHGHDFYATQTIEKDGSRVMVAWFDMWEQVYPERNDGWTGEITLPRLLTLTEDLRIIQNPVKEVEDARDECLHSGMADADTKVILNNNVGEISIEAPRYKNFELILEGGNTTVTISYNYLEGRITLDRGGEDGVRRTKWRPRYQDKFLLRLFVDRSTLELFFGEGEVTFSSRFFPYGEINVTLGSNCEVDEMTVYSMKQTVPAPGDQ